MDDLFSAVRPDQQGVATYLVVNKAPSQLLAVRPDDFALAVPFSVLDLAFVPEPLAVHDDAFSEALLVVEAAVELDQLGAEGVTVHALADFTVSVPLAEVHGELRVVPASKTVAAVGNPRACVQFVV